MKKITCCTCSTVFGMSDDLYDLRQQDEKSFVCPNGCFQHFSSEPTKGELRKKVKELEETVSQYENSLIAVRKELAYWHTRWAEGKDQLHLARLQIAGYKGQLVSRRNKEILDREIVAQQVRKMQASLREALSLTYCMENSWDAFQNALHTIRDVLKEYA